MKNMGKKLGMTFLASAILFGAASVSADEVKGYSMYRLYNPNSGEHFYTKDAKEQKGLVDAGWKDEGTGWYAPASGSPVYRLYNKNAGDHHYTLSQKEKDSLVKAGWKAEGIGWYSESDKGTKLYRAYNKNAKAGSHNYTLSSEEQNMLVKAGWKNEGIAWYGLQPGKTVITGTKDVSIDQTTTAFDAKKDVKATDFLGNDVNVTVEGSVDTKKVGVYTLTYKAVDGEKQTTIATRKVTVKKVANPTITGVKDVTINKSTGMFDFDKGVSAKGASGQALDVTMQTNLTKENPKSGTYTVTYMATDAFGNSASQKQTVMIVNDIKPVFTGVENAKVNITTGSFDVKSGVQATDGDGNVVVFDVTGAVDFTKPGNNELVYHAKDAAGNETTVKRNVEVFAIAVNSIELSGKQTMRTNTSQQLSVMVNPSDAWQKELTFTSSNEAVATVDAKGNLHSISEGTTTITAMTQNGVKKQMNIVVSDAIMGNVSGYGSFVVNGLMLGVSITFNSQDERELKVVSLSISDSGYPTTYTAEDLAEAGISTTVSPYGEFGVSLSSRLGYYEGKTVVKLIVEAKNGVQKEFTTTI